MHSKTFMFPTWKAPIESCIFPSLLSKNLSKTQRKTVQRSSLNQTRHLKLSLCVCVCVCVCFFPRAPKTNKKNIQKPWVFQTWWVVEVEPLRGCRGSEYSAWRQKLWHPNSMTVSLLFFHPFLLNEWFGKFWKRTVVLRHTHPHIMFIYMYL